MNKVVTISNAVEACGSTPNVNVKLLKAGDKLSVQTKNTLYELTVVDPEHSVVNGVIPMYGPEPQDVWLNGSTWGGSMLWMDRVGIGMHMEVVVPGKSTITTTLVREVRIEGDGWDYTLVKPTVCDKRTSAD